jgi:hypothetical protein
MQRTAYSLMVGGSIAWWLLYVPVEHDGIKGKGGFMLSNIGPHRHHRVVATNLPGQFPAQESDIDLAAALVNVAHNGLQQVGKAVK